MAVHFGDVPEWVAAVGTVGAFAGTLVVISRDRRHLRERHEERLWDEALLIDGAIGPVSVPGPRTSEGAIQTVISATVTNQSRRPIREVHMIVFDPKANIVAEHRFPSVPAESTDSFNFPPRDDLWRPFFGGGGQEVSWQITFRDVAGRRWRRDSNRHLDAI